MVERPQLSMAACTVRFFFFPADFFDRTTLIGPGSGVDVRSSASGTSYWGKDESVGVTYGDGEPRIEGEEVDCGVPIMLDLDFVELGLGAGGVAPSGISPSLSITNGVCVIEDWLAARSDDKRSSAIPDANM